MIDPKQENNNNKKNINEFINHGNLYKNLVFVLKIKILFSS